MKFNWKRTLTIAIDVVLAAYIAVAMTLFNKSDDLRRTCTGVRIDIQDEKTNGFINTEEVKHRLTANKLYPLKQPMAFVHSRTIEERLKDSPFVKSAQCYKTQDGVVHITLTQRMPIVRIKALNGEDYYVDDNFSVMPNSHYTSDMIIATGHINKWFARNYLAHLSNAIAASELWNNQIEQINVLPNRGVELVPRVGDHIVYLGELPEEKNQRKRAETIADFAKRKLTRLEKFYKYGLSQAGWNKYSYINLEFDNQIICTKRDGGGAPLPETQAAPAPTAQPDSARQAAPDTNPEPKTANNKKET